MSVIDFFEKESPVAAKQMSLTDDYKVFMVASQIDVVEDLDEKVEEMEQADAGYMNFGEAVEIINEECIKHADLPPGFRLVGLWIKDNPKSKKYGVVDLSSVGYK